MLRTITYTDTLVYYDGIEVFEGRDPKGDLYVGVLTDIQDDIGQYLVTCVSPDGLQELRSGSLDLRRLLLDSSEPEWYITNAMGDLSQPLLLEEQHQPLVDTDFLPDDGFFLNGSPVENDVLLQGSEQSSGSHSAKLRVNDPQARFADFFPEYEHAPVSSFQEVLKVLDEKSQNKREKGDVFEQLVKAFIEEDRAQSERFDRVWLWQEWPGNGGRPDLGADLVARERDGGGLVAIQCKFYGPNTAVDYGDVANFIAEYTRDQFSRGIFVSTTGRWTRNAEIAFEDRGDKPVLRWGKEIFEKSSIDWKHFSLTRPKALGRRATKHLWDFQKQAVEDTLRGFQENERGKLIMACGSGKTFTSLRIAEQVAGVGGSILFLTPSISLLSQSLIEWANDAELSLKTIAVCSDAKAGKRGDDDGDITPNDLIEPASTNPEKLVSQFRQVDHDTTMTAVFSTYQSLDVVAEAQKSGLPDFDLIICDEAHRTTGVRGTDLTGTDEANFQRVHDNRYIAGKKRLYMTATPRIYSDSVKRKANEKFLPLASMDDESIYGPEFHRLGFGRAIELGILSDYKVLIFDVDMEQTGVDLDSFLSDYESEVNLDNGARMIGCWNGLRKRGAEGVDFGEDPQPAKRAVAFSNTIEQSKLFELYFPQVVESCIKAGSQDADQSPLHCEVKHVDGTQHALARADHLAWLRGDTDDGACKILTNARCLTEGIDVPALDAILFLHPRRSEIDVVQAVGRVMRKSEGKQFGYIILPIAQAPGASPQETVSRGAYNAVWQVINAIIAHDDRFEARVNQLKLHTEDSLPEDYRGQGDIGVQVSGDEKETQGELPIVISGSQELRDAILARVVEKYANPRYWEEWATNIREIAERHEARIRALLRIPSSGVRPVFDEFLAGIRHNLNDGIGEDQAIGMLSQHLVTKPVFDALFEDYSFAEHNPVSQALQKTILSLQERGLEKETAGLENFYRDVRIRAQGITTAGGKQQIIAELYERFLRLALPDTAANLGIVYTPTQVVDYILRSVEELLNQEFGASFSDDGVHVIDPFVGTGTFVTRLLQGGFIRNADLKRKYEQELHANDIVLLAYYIATINIESTFHDLSDAEEYRLFSGIVLTDTFESAEQRPPMDTAFFPGNHERVERQLGLDIRVVIGNPPWSGTDNREYPFIDGRVKKSYADLSNNKLLSALYDPYVKAIRLASDRIQEGGNGGIVAFVINGGFIESNSFDGFRKAVSEEFDAVYCYNLRGDARTSGDRRQREAGGIFGAGSRAGVALLLLAKRPIHLSEERQQTGATIYYRDIGDYLSRDQKLDILSESSLSRTAWQQITPNSDGDWVNQRSDSFRTLRPLTLVPRASRVDQPAPVFELQTLGVSTNRDAWCYNSSGERLRENIKRSIGFFNDEVLRFQGTKPIGLGKELETQAEAFTIKDSIKFHWRPMNHKDLAAGVSYDVDEAGFRVGMYRPFLKQRFYFSRRLNERVGSHFEIYPRPDAKNLIVTVSRTAPNNSFHTLMTDSIPDLHLTGDSVCFPRWKYVGSDEALEGHPSARTSLDLVRVSNINEQALDDFRQQYADRSITADDLFYYTYGVLHSQQWRDTFAADLAKLPARIPMAASTDDFRRFAYAGRELADLHVSYESVEPYELDEVYEDGWDPESPAAFQVKKMAYAGKRPHLDRSRIVYNSGVTLAGIPEKAHDYRLGTRSALDWVLDRYRVATHKNSGITNDPNDWSTEVGDPRYIVDLVKRVTTISVRTVDIAADLPELPI